MPGRDSSMIKCSQEQEGAFKDEGNDKLKRWLNYGKKKDCHGLALQ